MESESSTGWKKSKLKDHGILEVEIKSCQDGYQFLNLPVRQFFGKVSAVTDSGAQMTVGRRNTMKTLNIKEEDLTETSLKIKVADSRDTKVLGAALTEIRGRNKFTKENRVSFQVIYFVEGVKGLYLSQKCLQDLGVLTNNFPLVGDHSTGRRTDKKVDKNSLTKPSQESNTKQSAEISASETGSEDVGMKKKEFAKDVSKNENEDVEKACDGNKCEMEASMPNVCKNDDDKSDHGCSKMKYITS